MKRNITLAFLLIAALALLGVAAVDVPDSRDSNSQILRFEVAENAGAATIIGDNLFEDGMPSAGNTFITHGYLYPEGTLDGTNGVLANGEPEFSDRVIGEWTCYGWLVGDGLHTETGAWVASTQIYQLNDSYGNATITTDGFEIVDINQPFARAITGGTGMFSGMVGEQTQTLLGVTDQMGVNLSVEFNFNEQ